MSGCKTKISSTYSCQGGPAPSCQALLVGTESPKGYHTTACSVRSIFLSYILELEVWVGWEVRAQDSAMPRTIIHATKLLISFVISRDWVLEQGCPVKEELSVILPSFR